MLPYFIFGGFVIPLGIEAARTLFARRVQLKFPHFLTLFIVAYLLLSAWLIRPMFEHLRAEMTVPDFVRWQLREVIPLLAVLATAWARPRRSVEGYLHSLVVVAAILAWAGLVEYLVLVATGQQLLGLVRPEARVPLFTTWLFAHNATGGIYAGLAAASFWWVSRKRLRLWVVGGNLLGLGLTGSRSAYFGFIVVAFAYLFTRPNLGRLRKPLIAAGLVVAALLAAQWGPLAERVQDAFASPEEALGSRVGDTQKAFGDFASSPIVGIGWGNFSRFSGQHAHNSYLHVAAELGLVGLFLLGWWVVSIAYLLWKKKRFDLLAALGAVAASAIFDHNFGAPSITAPIFLVIGMAITAQTDTEQPRRLRGGALAPRTTH